MSNLGESFIQSVLEAPEPIQKTLRQTQKGLFIPEGKLDEVYEAYQAWLSKNNLSLKSEEKLALRVFGLEEPSLVYLPEGSVCFAGFLSPHKIEPGTNSKVPVSASVLIDSLNYVHPKDPWIGSISGIRIKSSPQSGTVFEFSKSINGEHVNYITKESELRSFVEFIRSSSRFSSEFPLMKRSMRDAVEAFHKIIFASKSIGEKKFLMIPEELKAVSELSFRNVSNLILVINAQRKILKVYETRGKNFFQFLEDEIKYLTEKKSLKNVEVIELARSHKYVLGRVKIKKEFISIEKRAFFTLVDGVQRSSWFRSKLPFRYSIQDILVHISGALKYADWVDMTKLGQDTKGVINGKNRYELKYTPWTFRTGKSGNIFEFVENRGSVRP